MTHLLHQLPLLSAQQRPAAPALTLASATLSYGELADLLDRVATGLVRIGVGRGERVAFYLDKRFETVAVAFGAAYAGAVFVPVNPLLKAEQVGHILRDCNVRVVVTSAERLDAVAATLAECPDLRPARSRSAGRPSSPRPAAPGIG
jgi:acyl-CoA synthetase (AMP-forming)/AMP-acid ligase II